jgi:ABC-type glycerol-3-phosphate transport system substrate-binding protein
MIMTVGRRTLARIAVAAGVSVLMAGCGSSSSGGSGTPAAGGDATSAPNLAGKSYSVLGQWTGGEQAAFQSVIDAFDKQTGAKGHYSAVSGGDEATVLGAKVNGGTPPDIAILALPGAIAQYGKAGKAEPVSEDGQSVTAENFSAEWAKLATVNGTLYGVPVDAANKSTVWYNTNLFNDAGISDPPESWDDLIADSKTLGDSGVSVPISVGGGDGWTLTDWFENVYLRTAGVDMYDKLTHHEIKWTDPSVATALKALKQIWGDESLIGKSSKALSTPFTDSVDNVFKKSPTSAMVYEASFVATTITSDKNPAKVGVDAKFVPSPAIDGSEPVLEASGDWAVRFTKNEAATAFQAYLGTPEAAKLLVSAPGSGFLSANKNLLTSAYPDATSGQLAQQIVEVGDNFRFDMSDQAPAEFGGTPNKGEWAALQSFLGNGDVAGTQQKLEKDASEAKGW